MAQHIANETIVTGSQALVKVYMELQATMARLLERAAAFAAIDKKLQEEGALEGGEADATRERFSDMAKVIEKISESTSAIKGPLDAAIAATTTLEHGSRAASDREDAKKAMANSGVLKKE